MPLLTTTLSTELSTSARLGALVMPPRSKKSSSSQQRHHAILRYTCEECIQGLEWVEMYIEDPIMIAEYVVYLEQNFCHSDWDDCKELVVEHFAAMHTMAMEKFFIPTEICMSEPVCGADPPTKPPFF
jgi:hypothetical protein